MAIAIFKKIIFFLFLGFCQIGIIYSFPFPFNQINILFSFLLALLVINYPLSKIALWGAGWALFLSVFSLYPSLVIFAFLASLGISFLLFQNLITNYSLQPLIFLSLTSVFFYQTIIWAGKYIFFFFPKKINFPLGFFFKTTLASMALTALTSLIFFYLLSHYRQKYAH